MDDIFNSKIEISLILNISVLNFSKLDVAFQQNDTFEDSLFEVSTGILVHSTTMEFRVGKFQSHTFILYHKTFFKFDLMICENIFSCRWIIIYDYSGSYFIFGCVNFMRTNDRKNKYSCIFLIPNHFHSNSNHIIFEIYFLIRFREI